MAGPLTSRVATRKTTADFAKMLVAGRCVASVLEAVRSAVAPGVATADLDAIAVEVIRAHGCRPSFLGYHGYPATICVSPNSAVVHGIPGRHRLREGDIVSIDAGAAFEGWHGDAALTVAVGEVAPEVTALIEVTERALANGIAATVAGNRLGDVGHAVESTVVSHGYGIVRDYVGHGIGRSMHEAPDVPNTGAPGKGLRLKPGMALAIEPMITLGSAETATLEDGWTVVTADGSWAAHFEHTVLITDEGQVVSTAPAPS